MPQQDRDIIIAVDFDPDIRPNLSL